MDTDVRGLKLVWVCLTMSKRYDTSRNEYCIQNICQRSFRLETPARRGAYEPPGHSIGRKPRVGSLRTDLQTRIVEWKRP